VKTEKIFALSAVNLPILQLQISVNFQKSVKRRTLATGVSLHQGTPTEVEGSLLLTSSFKKIVFTFSKAPGLNLSC
jgi:hypothetical protein